MESPDQMNLCAICLSGMGVGGGQAIFMAECSHTFHFHCISASVAYGHLLCPLCNAPWRELPFVRPAAASVPPTHPPLQPPSVDVVPLPLLLSVTTQPADPDVFDDDEQVEPAAAAPSNRAVVVKTYTDYSAVARDSSRDNFAVLVHLKATGTEAPREPLDLVMVLDVSRSMHGRKLELLKQAMRFVVDILGPEDRFCIVSFSSTARRVTRLMRMTDAGKALCVRAVESLTALRGTNIAEGLRTAAKVLDERRYRNGFSSVVLLSDGQDNCTLTRQALGSRPPNYAALVPPSLARMGTTTGGRTAPIHTFGFGRSHDAAAMHVIAEASGGTFSFIENEAVIQDAFAQCVGGLLSVVVQDARLAVACVHPGVRVVSVKSGVYESRVDEDGRAASVAVGELYADEERRFLLFLAVPAAGETDGEVTTLLKVSCVYRDATAGVEFSVTAEDAVVARPEHAPDLARSVEVERELIRVETTEDIAASRAAAERGAHQEAVEILENRWRAVAQSDAARGGDAMIAALEIELRGMLGRVSSQQNYARSGRAHMLAGMSAHMHQRSSSSSLGSWSELELLLSSAIGFHAGGVTTSMEGTRQDSHRVDATLPYATPAILAMLLRSRRAREAAAEGRLEREEAEGSDPN
ncbi:E3 ubiquitin-protein ligase WAV3 [Lolium perenne]|uniref:E3 ubiquitin-protein ligase WAV3 n=1 Tax=Lolium perenne TaxID=4522 RepID=UPI0021F649F6|nr:E3 ubiquitin-protein ligase WAV3-like [Lolium perenne]